LRLTGGVLPHLRLAFRIADVLLVALADGCGTFVFGAKLVVSSTAASREWRRKSPTWLGVLESEDAGE
jgi:hypothetical protein